MAAAGAGGGAGAVAAGGGGVGGGRAPGARPGCGGAAGGGRRGRVGGGVVRWAGVLGQECAVADLVVVSGGAGGRLVGVGEEAVAAGVVTEAADAGVSGGGIGAVPRLAFQHGLIRQVLYDGMPPTVRE